jgi:hypothetical protein
MVQSFIYLNLRLAVCIPRKVRRKRQIRAQEFRDRLTQARRSRWQSSANPHRLDVDCSGLFQRGGPLSAVPAILAGGAAIMAIAGILFFHEAPSWQRLAGVAFAIVGLFLLRK